MRYLIDTNLVSVLDKHPKARVWVTQHQLETAVSAVTVAEMAQGVALLPQGAKRRLLEQGLRELLDSFVILPFDTAAALQWAQYTAGKLKVGRPLQTHDSYIAATALANSLTVVTRNTKDFPGVETFDPVP